jgi:hypothetical protein|tara:strand:- start:156 stop:485 length:330 start_codon:yes stop_codon:yes gene_type:complete
MGITPYLTASKLIQCKSEFLDILDYCGRHGVIISTDKVFACGYPTHSECLNDSCSLIVDKPNCWYVHLLAGDPKYIFDMVKPLEYVCFERFDNKYRLYKFSKLKRRYGK